MTRPARKYDMSPFATEDRSRARIGTDARSGGGLRWYLAGHRANLLAHTQFVGRFRTKN